MSCKATNTFVLHLAYSMHCSVCHGPKCFGNTATLSNFMARISEHATQAISKTCSIGAEKNNDDSKRHYFSSNHYDAPAEIIRSDIILWRTNSLSGLRKPATDAQVDRMALFIHINIRLPVPIVPVHKEIGRTDYVATSR